MPLQILQKKSGELAKKEKFSDYGNDIVANIKDQQPVLSQNGRP
jgi:hypothetical protein